MTDDLPPLIHRRPEERRLCGTRRADGSTPFVRTPELWALAAGLPVRKRRVRELGLDEVRWFGGPMKVLPTCRAVAEHARDIEQADLSFPIVLSPTGEVVDGMHRLCKAYLLGLEEIDTVQLPAMPVPRWRLRATGEEVPIAEGEQEA